MCAHKGFECIKNTKYVRNVRSLGKDLYCGKQKKSCATCIHGSGACAGAKKSIQVKLCRKIFYCLKKLECYKNSSKDPFWAKFTHKM